MNELAASSGCCMTELLLRGVARDVARQSSHTVALSLHGIYSPQCEKPPKLKKPCRENRRNQNQMVEMKNPYLCSPAVL